MKCKYVNSILIFLLFWSSPLFSQNNELIKLAGADSHKLNNHDDYLTISLLTCGPGAELYASFGHTGIRIIDAKQHTDEVYNYGMFNYGDPNFYSKFTLGKLDYYVAKYAFEHFVEEYKLDNRFVKEQLIQLPIDKKIAIQKYLEYNILPKNRMYKYDFLFDNCATRVRDVFSESLGIDFFYNDVIGKQQLSYRTIINTYLSQNHWARTGINILLGSKVDSIMTNEGSMFLPDFLFAGMQFGKYMGDPIVSAEKVLVAESPLPKSPVNGPLVVTFVILLLALGVKYIRSLQGLQGIVFKSVLFITGLLGCIILFMWLFTNHQSCDNNFNILWAFPLNIVVAFLAYKGTAWSKLYALIGISLVIVTVLVHIIGLQNLPFIEILCLLVTLMLVYVDMYQNALMQENKK